MKHRTKIIVIILTLIVLGLNASATLAEVNEFDRSIENLNEASYPKAISTLFADPSRFKNIGPTRGLAHILWEKGIELDDNNRVGEGFIYIEPLTLAHLLAKILPKIDDSSSQSELSIEALGFVFSTSKPTSPTLLADLDKIASYVDLKDLAAYSSITSDSFEKGCRIALLACKNEKDLATLLTNLEDQDLGYIISSITKSLSRFDRYFDFLDLNWDQVVEAEFLATLASFYAASPLLPTIKFESLMQSIKKLQYLPRLRALMVLQSQASIELKDLVSSFLTSEAPLNRELTPKDLVHHLVADSIEGWSKIEVLALDLKSFLKNNLVDYEKPSLKGLAIEFILSKIVGGYKSNPIKRAVDFLNFYLSSGLQATQPIAEIKPDLYATLSLFDNVASPDFKPKFIGWLNKSKLGLVSPVLLRFDQTLGSSLFEAYLEAGLNIDFLSPYQVLVLANKAMQEFKNKSGKDKIMAALIRGFNSIKFDFSGADTDLIAKIINSPEFLDLVPPKTVISNYFGPLPNLKALEARGVSFDFTGLPRNIMEILHQDGARLCIKSLPFKTFLQLYVQYFIDYFISDEEFDFVHLRENKNFSTELLAEEPMYSIFGFGLDDYEILSAFFLAPEEDYQLVKDSLLREYRDSAELLSEFLGRDRTMYLQWDPERTRKRFLELFLHDKERLVFEDSGNLLLRILGAKTIDMDFFDLPTRAKIIERFQTMRGKVDVSGFMSPGEDYVDAFALIKFKKFEPNFMKLLTQWRFDWLEMLDTFDNPEFKEQFVSIDKSSLIEALKSLKIDYSRHPKFDDNKKYNFDWDWNSDR